MTPRELASKALADLDSDRHADLTDLEVLERHFAEALSQERVDCAVICAVRSAEWAMRERSDISLPRGHCRQRGLEALHLAQAIRARGEK